LDKIIKIKKLPNVSPSLASFYANLGHTWLQARMRAGDAPVRTRAATHTRAWHDPADRLGGARGGRGRVEGRARPRHPAERQPRDEGPVEAQVGNGFASEYW